MEWNFRMYESGKKLDFERKSSEWISQLKDFDILNEMFI